MKKVCLLENNIITPFSNLTKETLNPETLNVTECRQYWEKGLLHITDSAYEFFITLEQKGVDCVNLGKLIAHQANMIDNSIHEVSNSKILCDQFDNLFHVDQNEEKVIIFYINYAFFTPFH